MEDQAIVERPKSPVSREVADGGEEGNGQACDEAGGTAQSARRRTGLAAQPRADEDPYAERGARVESIVLLEGQSDAGRPSCDRRRSPSSPPLHDPERPEQAEEDGEL